MRQYIINKKEKSLYTLQQINEKIKATCSKHKMYRFNKREMIIYEILYKNDEA